jgi:hypothetical protein
MRSIVAVASCVALGALAACGPQAEPARPSDPASGAGPAVRVPPRPVMMGGDAVLDACAGLSQVKPGRSLLIRSAPDPNAEIKHSLPEGVALWICEDEGAPDGWTGVAFDTPDGPKTCDGVATPSADRVPVPSVCQSGWAQFGDDVEDIAG